MKLSDLIAREFPEPWTNGGKIPWDDPAFSERMLREHLSQDHDRASRRAEKIDRHVQWLHKELLGGRHARILDLGCGPGFYTTRLAKLGHACVGIDFSPASIAHARSEADRENLSCEYRRQDLRGGRFGRGFQAALFIFGEFNTFSRNDAGGLLKEVRQALVPGGVLVLEVHREATVRELGRQGPTWFTARQGLFSEAPHLCLHECSWSEKHRVATERYFVIEVATGEVTQYLSTTQAYSDAEYESLIREQGFELLERCPSLEGPASDPDEDFFVLVGRARETAQKAGPGRPQVNGTPG